MARPTGRSTPRMLAAAWAVIFAALHIVWAMGWSIGLGDVGELPVWFLLYDLAVAFACLAAAATAIWGRRGLLVLVGAVPLLRGLLGAGALTVQLIDGNYVPDPTLWVEVYFIVGGVLFGIAVRSARYPRPLPASVQRLVTRTGTVEALTRWFTGERRFGQ